MNKMAFINEWSSVHMEASSLRFWQAFVLERYNQQEKERKGEGARGNTDTQVEGRDRAQREVGKGRRKGGEKGRNERKMIK